mmetsp:Transcript_105528/g.251432  ORF Transcript_105528/g.251432 Transcript_105528/m.251432 type:complete len:80 (-) Transcript_105528:446-685(-)
MEPCASLATGKRCGVEHGVAPAIHPSEVPGLWQPAFGPGVLGGVAGCLHLLGVEKQDPLPLADGCLAPWQATDSTQAGH